MSHVSSSDRNTTSIDIPATAGPEAGCDPAAHLTLQGLPEEATLRWSWACRTIEAHRNYRIVSDKKVPPQVGDVALAQVESIGYHSRLTVTGHERLRLYPGDLLVGVYGNRYATDAYEAEVTAGSDLHILTGAGMIGSVLSRHEKMKAPTRLNLLGYLADEVGERINLKGLHFHPSGADQGRQNVILVVGTGMNSGKTTVGARLVKGLLRKGLRTAVFKLTGSVSHQDRHELWSTGPHDVRDFSDYGFPSTYKCDEQELQQLFDTMLTDAGRVNPDVVVVEVADGVLQRETQIVLGLAEAGRRVKGVVLTATCAASALTAISRVEKFGHQVMAVSGVVTNSPLFMRELAENSSVPVVSSAHTGDQLAARVALHVTAQT